MKINIILLLSISISFITGYSTCYYACYRNCAHVVRYYFPPFEYNNLNEDEIRKRYGEDVLLMFNHIKDKSIYGDLKTTWINCLNKADEVRLIHLKDSKIEVESYWFHNIHNLDDTTTFTKYSILICVDKKHKIVVGAFVNPSTY